MDSDLTAEVVSTLQSAHIKHHPSPHHDINPSTSGLKQEPVVLNAHSDDVLAVDGDEIPISVLDPLPRRNTMPPLPDLRFEQSYLKSIQHAETWKGVAWITLRDQVIMCFTQGVLWTLLLSGWRHWNSSAKFSGQSVGARIRRWWWGVNKWKIPELNDRKLAKGVREFYQNAI